MRKKSKRPRFSSSTARGKKVHFMCQLQLLDLKKQYFVFLVNFYVIFHIFPIPLCFELCGDYNSVHISKLTLLIETIFFQKNSFTLQGTNKIRNITPKCVTLDRDLKKKKSKSFHKLLRQLWNFQTNLDKTMYVLLIIYV